MSSREGEPARGAPPDFIRAMIADDQRTGKYGGRVATRFPPEPNGYLHIGHAKSICLNFGVAVEHEDGTCNLRFDDTNPTTEDQTYVEAIERDVHWLGFDWDDRLYYASDYFEQLFQYAEQLIQSGKAYVDSLSEADIREYRGTVTKPGTESPYRSRTVEENLDLFRRMRAGEFEDGALVLRAKIDMASPNMLMRDPLLYRIRHAHHYRTGDEWCIYPFYDFAHCLSDAIEDITHSLCTLEFKDNRALYDWVLDSLHIAPRPEQTEFARLNLEYTVLSKRRLRALVEGGHVDGWDDPRMPTIAGLRRRGVTPEAIRTFCDMVGVAKVDSRVDIEKLEYAIRDDLNRRVPRVMCVVRPLRVVIENFPEDHAEEIEAPYYPHDIPLEGSRTVPFSRVLYIEREDFQEDPPKKFYRLAPGREVRLRYAYYVKCVDVVKDPTSGEVVEVRCTYDPETRGGGSPDGRKVKGTLHWVSAARAVPVTVRLYDRLFTVPAPDEITDSEEFLAALNPQSLVTHPESYIEPSVADDPPGTRYQCERQGYFISDPVDSSRERLVFNRTVPLRDTWAKVAADQPEASVPPRRTAAARAHPRPSPTEASDRMASRSPELRARLARYTDELGVPHGDAEILTRHVASANFFEAAIATHDNPRHVAKWIVNDVQRALKGGTVADLAFDGAQLGALIALIDSGTISRNAAKDVFAEMVERGGDPREIAEERGVGELPDASTLTPIIEQLLIENAEKVTQYRTGRIGLLGFFVGRVMRASGGKADPQVVKDMVQRALTG